MKKQEQIKFYVWSLDLSFPGSLLTETCNNNDMTGFYVCGEIKGEG